eukprot:scaffold191126_cov14-Tisochrysis_lutea.AAC.1
MDSEAPAPITLFSKVDMAAAATGQFGKRGSRVKEEEAYFCLRGQTWGCVHLEIACCTPCTSPCAPHRKEKKK